MITLIVYPPCSTCKKAKTFLQSNNIEFDTRHIVNNPPTKEELKTWMAMYDINVDSFFNTHGKVYRTLQLKDKKNTLSIDEKLDMLSREGMLIKRPLLLIEKHLLIGFKEMQWKDALKTR